MTNYELDKLAKKVAAELLGKIADDADLLDVIIPPKCMSITEAAEYTRVPVSTLYHKISEIPHVKIGKRLLFTDRGLIRWMKRQ
jgi:excisionase family DNA binding protein